MAQAGAIDVLMKLRLEKAQRAKEAATKADTSSATKTPVSHPAQQVPPVDLARPLTEKKTKKKSKDKSRCQDTPQHSPKRAKIVVGGVGSSRGSELVSHDLEFHKGVNISLTQAENEVLMSFYKGDFMTDVLELQARAMAAVRLLAHEHSKGSAKELEDLKLRLANSQGALKKTMVAKFAFSDQVNQLTADLSTSKSTVLSLEARCATWRGRRRS